LAADENLKTAAPQPYKESDQVQPDDRGRRMDLGTLKALLDSNKVAALASMQSSKLSAERDDALMYYMGDMSKDMPAMDGRSEAVSSDVQDTIEGLMPSLMEIFTGSEEVVKFNPVGPEDVQAAEQETDYINHVFMNENPGFLILYHFIKDALLSKVGIVKCWWENEEVEEKETYHDLTDDEFNILVDDPEVEIIAHTKKPAPPEMQQLLLQARTGQQSVPSGGAPSPSPQAPPNYHDVQVVKRKTYGRAKVAPVAPEEFGIEKTARTLRQGHVGGCNYCFHRVIRSQDELIAQGFDEEQIRSLPTYMAITNIEEINRDTVAEHQNVGEEMNPASRRIEVIEHYVRMDYEGDGKARLYKVTTGSEQGQILYKGEDPDIVEFDEIPFAAMTPVIVTHRFFGRSLADLTMDLQRIKTALTRGLLDNLYLANNPRVEVAETFASDSTLDDLLISRPGGIVRTKQPGGLNWQEVPTISNQIYPAFEYFDSVREVRTGVTKQGQSIDSNALQNQSATAVNQMFTMAQARMRLIARIFAETGIKDLFILLHGIVRKHGQEQQTVRLRNQWVNIDPRDWKKRDDMQVSVGLGTGGKAEQMALINMIIAMQEKALQGGLTNLVTPENLYSSAKVLTRIAGHKDVDAFFTDPKTQPPPQPPPDPKIIVAQMQGQLQREKQQGEIALEKARMMADGALEQQKFEHQKQLDILEMGMKEREHAQKMQLEHHKAAIDLAKTQHQAELQTQLNSQQMGLNEQSTRHSMALNEQNTQHKIGVEHEKHKPQADSNKNAENTNKIMTELLSHLKQVNAPKVRKLHRDPKTGKATHMTEEIVK